MDGLKKELLDLVEKAGRKNYIRSLQKNPDLHKRVLDVTHGYDIPLAERVSVILSGESPFCEKGKRRRFKGFGSGFGYCGRGHTCSCFMSEASAKTKQGIAGRSPEEQTRINEKRVTTAQHRYGTENVSQVREIRERAEKTTRERFGVNYIFERDDIRRSALMQKYGVTNVAHIPGVREKARETYRDRTGYEHPMHNPEIREKVANRDVTHMPRRVRETKLEISYQNVLGILPSTILPCFDRDEWVGCQDDGSWVSYLWRCSTCQNVFSRTMQDFGNIRCRNCTPISFQSRAEIDLGDFINGLSPIRRSDRSLINPYELDIVCDEKKIAIEYCGLYWHSEKSQGKDSHYHIGKLERCLARGYRLVTVFEDEWLNRSSIVKTRLCSIFGKSPRSVGARSLDLRTISPGEAKDFLSRYHLQGSGPSGHTRYGAFLEDRLCAVMTFGSPRRALGRKSGHPELLRFATDGLSYPGIASRLFRRYIRDHQPSGVISYADRRWSVGNLYERLGFVCEGYSKPSYAYTKGYLNREYRFKYRKDVLVREGEDQTLTEWEIMQNRGYDRIWDCGTTRWVWKP